MELRSAKLEDLASLRRAKIDSLRVRVFPDRHERIATGAQCYRIDEGHAEPGYAIFLERSDRESEVGRRLIEFDVSVPWRGRAHEYLAKVAAELEVQQIEVRTDDGTALEPALVHAADHGWGVDPLTAIYALETGMLRRQPKPEGAEVKLVGKDEVEAVSALLAEEPDLPPEPRSEESIAGAIGEKRLWGLYQAEKLVGAAEILPQASHRYADLRPVIHPDLRRGGYATYLAGEVSQELLSTNHRLMTEAAASGWAWRRMAEKLGLTLAAHRLLLRKR
jgi:hypothetical protein